MENYNCHDCGKQVEVKEEEIIGGKLLAYQNGKEKIHIIKCDECFDRSKELNDYQETEVWSRVVGYMRPVTNWNPGKQAEFGDRKNYNLNDTCCG